MKRTVRSFLTSFLFSHGLTVDIKSTKESILDFIERTKPQNVDIELIRFGDNCDGGYLIPNDLDGILACFSPGVGELCSFELDCAKYGMQVYLADSSVSVPPVNNSKFQFLKKYIGPVSYGEYITMDEWVSLSIQSDAKSDLMLQMDIEGLEYLTILSISENLLKRFRIIVLECHNLHKMWNTANFEIINLAFLKLLRTHTCVHIHPNNVYPVHFHEGIAIPKVAEFSFIRSSRHNIKKPQSIFPHPLDYDCTTNPTVVLPKQWYIS